MLAALKHRHRIRARIRDVDINAFVALALFFTVYLACNIRHRIHRVRRISEPDIGSMAVMPDTRSRLGLEYNVGNLIIRIIIIVIIIWCHAYFESFGSRSAPMNDIEILSIYLWRDYLLCQIHMIEPVSLVEQDLGLLHMRLVII